MSTQVKAVAIAAGVLVVAVGAFFVLRGRGGDLPVVGGAFEPATCPLTGREPAGDVALDRPAVAVKIENAAVAYPLSGLEKADIVYEETVEGGITRFMAIYHCRDAAKAGPVRSARLIDAAILTPTTRILAFSGANRPVLEALREADVVQVTESSDGAALRRIARQGVSSEHTLYAHSGRVRKAGARRFDDAPPEPFGFGELEGRGRRARSVTIDFSGATTVGYEWSEGGWLRSQEGEPFTAESGRQITVDNVLIEQHTVNFSDTIVDVAGNPSVEIEDVTGSGRAMLFRNGRAIAGRWTRDSVESPVVFETRAGDPMVLAPGNTWIELVPNGKGDVKGSFSFAR
jgi:hypothetical protein